MKFRASAKVNLSLDVLEKDPSGFHIIQTVYHELPDFFDEIEIEPFMGNGRGDEIFVQCDHPDVPKDETNTALKAARLLKAYAQKNSAQNHGALKNHGALGAKIFIKKRIPLLSGLGGGSSDAAAVLKGLNELWHLNFSEEELQKFGQQIGMDVPFFFLGGTALGEHYGERITSLPLLPSSLRFSVIDTGVKVSSQWAYSHVDIAQCGKQREKTQAAMAAIHAGDAQGIIQNIHNDFEPLLQSTYPELRRLKDKTLEHGAQKVWFTGSGGALIAAHISV